MEYLVKKFTDWKNQWSDPSQMGIMNYISFNIHPEDVLILSYLFFPRLIEVDNCLFLEANFNEANYTLWVEKYGKDRLSLEKTINHIHVYDIFSNCEDDVSDSTFEEIGKLLQSSWLNHFRQNYPSKAIVVDFVNNEKEYGPTLYVYQK